jgi:hypothetical protein
MNLAAIGGAETPVLAFEFLRVELADGAASQTDTRHAAPPD